jgi:repressor LexA
MRERGIFSGDLVIIKSTRIARDGEIVVAVVDNEATLKEFKKVEGGRRIKLIPHNSELEPQIYEADAVEIRGVLTSVVRTDP